MLGSLAVCTAGGALCAWLRTPLPWMIGSMLAMASVQMAGARLVPLPGGRDAGMLVVGVSLGLYFTIPVLHEVAAYWPWFVFLGFAAIGFGAVSALVLMRLASIDRATAYFGSMPGGASEMAAMGENHGAAPDRVAFAHSFRMLVVVTVVPVSITLAGFNATEDYRPVTVPFDSAGLAILFAAAAFAGLVARRVGAPTAYTMGPLFLTIALTAGGIQLSSVPTPFTNAAQVLLGCALGARFDRGFLAIAPRFVTALVPSVAVMLGLAALTGWSRRPAAHTSARRCSRPRPGVSRRCRSPRRCCASASRSSPPPMWCATSSSCSSPSPRTSCLRARAPGYPDDTDMVGGQAQVMFNGMLATYPFVKDGKLKVLAVSSARRFGSAPDIATVAELGMPGFETGSWQGIVAPAGTPPEIVNKLHATVNAILATPEMKDRLDKAGAEVRPQSPAQFGAFIRSERDRWAKVVKESGARFD